MKQIVCYSLYLFGVSALPSFATETASEGVDEHVVVEGTPPAYLHHLQDVLPVKTIDSSPLNSFGSAAEALTSAPEVTFNGQGGLLQTLSIRGLSRWRVQTLVEGVPIHSERRAGNAAEFVAPGLLGRSYLLPGAASTQLGSGALGGGIDLRLNRSFDTSITAGLGVQQDYRDIQAIGGNDHGDYSTHWGASYRHANNGEAANNTTLLDGFEQSVGWAGYSSDTSFIKDALILISTANNIGKASSDLPTDRITEYPSNDHWLARVDFNWLNARVYTHQFDLDTDVLRPGSRFNDLSNTGLTWGASIGDNILLSDWSINWKLALDARSDVEATEREISPEQELVFDRTNLSAQQKAWSVSTDATRQWNGFVLASGFRVEHMTQDNTQNNIQNIILDSDSDSGADSNSDTNVSAFIAAKQTWGSGWSTGLYASSAFRVPVLTERYFNGSTPRGITLGDPNLESEQGRSIQVDIDYQINNFEFGLSASRQWIDNYIERINLSDELQQYVNLGDATIDSVNYLLNWSATSQLTVRFSGQWLSGEDNTGGAINDVSPPQHDMNISYQFNAVDTWFNLTYRQRHGRPGDSELPIGGTVFMSTGLSIAVNDSLTVSAQVNNLADRVYAVSTDDLSPLATGRDARVSMTYLF